MARDVEVDVVARDKTGPGLDSAERKFSETNKKIEEDSKRSGQAIKRLGTEGERAVGRLKNELSLAQRELKGMSIAFANAQTAAERLDISKAIRRQEAEIRRVSKNIKIIDPKALEEDVEEVGGAFSKVFGTIGADLTPILITAAAAAAPAIGAVVSAGVIGGAAGLGVVGGVLLAARDPRVKQAGKTLGVNLLGQLESDANVFIDPVIANIGKIGAAFNRLDPIIERVLGRSASFIDPLVDGLTSGVEGILKGIDSLTANAEPVVDALGKSFTILGDSVGQALTTISGDSEDAASALLVLVKATAATVEGVGYLVRGLTELYGVVSFIPSKISDLSDTLAGYVGYSEQQRTSVAGVTTALYGQADAMIKARQGINATAEGLDYTNELLAANQKRLDDAAQAARDKKAADQGLYGQEIAVAQAFSDANEKIKEHGKGLDLTTQKGRDNRTAINNVANAINSEYENLIKVNGVTPTTSAQAQTLRNRFVELATKAGYSAGAAQNLANRLLNIPKNVNTKIKADPSDAVQASRDAKAALNSVHSRSVSINVTVNTSRLDAVEQRLSRLHGVGIGASAGSNWAALDRQGGTARTGGPVRVSSVIENTIMLDGKPFRQYTDNAISASNRRERWRQRTGTRD